MTDPEIKTFLQIYKDLQKMSCAICDLKFSKEILPKQYCGHPVCAECLAAIEKDEQKKFK